MLLTCKCVACEEDFEVEEDEILQNHPGILYYVCPVCSAERRASYDEEDWDED